MRKKAIVIGSGAGGATAALALQENFDVTILEAGHGFHPFTLPLKPFEKLRHTGVLFDEQMIRMLIPNMVIDKTKDMVLVSGRGVGGTTTLATGNAVRYDGALKKLGIRLDDEFDALYRELPITTDHQQRWTKTTRRMFDIFNEMGLDPQVTPKLLYPDKCIGCGHCAIGCPTGAKWDTRALVDQAVKKGAVLITGCRVTDLTIKDNTVTAVNTRLQGRKITYKADVIVLAAGGLGSPRILQNSGIACQDTLFVDPVLCLAGPLPGIRQDKQILMPFISQQDGYILSPYMDYLSFFFDKNWRQPMDGIASIMIKLADEEKGTVGKKINKTMTETDHRNLNNAIRQCQEFLLRLDIPLDQQFYGILNAGHPGGTLPLTAAEKDTLHNPSLPANLYVADATILPEAMGNPPILTIMALARRIAALIAAN